MRKRGQGRCWLRGHTYWIQFYDAGGKQIRESAKIAEETVALKLLKKRTAEITTGVFEDRHAVRFEQMQAEYLCRL